MSNNLTSAGESLIKEFEGLRLKAYRCSAGKWTIGWGSTFNVREGDEITIEDAQRLFEKDIKWAKDCVQENVEVPLNDNQFSSLVSFCYNVGETNFKKSTLLRLLNKGWYEQVPPQLTRWCKVNGEEIGGLKLRRGAEANLWSEENGRTT